MSAEIEQARKELLDGKREAAEALAQLPSESRFEMAGECLDRNGNLTRALIINTDKPGIVGEIIDRGAVYSLGADGVKEDKSNLAHYTRFMANVDLFKADVQEAVGLDAVMQARSAVSNFFMLKMVSSLPVIGLEDQNSSSVKTTPSS